MATPKRLIVTADDLGRSTGVNRGILEAHRHGIVTASSLMVTARAASEAGTLARENPQLGVGLHVVLTAGVPAEAPGRVPSLVDPHGRFGADPGALGAARSEEVLLECRAQLRRFRELTGRDPTHLDSHHNAHRLPAVFEALVTLAWETGLPVRRLDGPMAERLRQERIPAADQYVDSFHGQGARVDALVEILGALELGTTELACHPAIVDDELRRSSRYAEERAKELAVLVDREVRQAIQAAGIRLVHYGVLDAA